MPATGTGNEAAVNIGVSLRSARESQGKSVEEAARITRIGKNYLLAIEEGTFDKLPSVAYTKGFLRIYASYLGLSGDDVVRRYEESQGAEQVARPAEKEDAEVAKSRSAAGDGPRGRWVLPAVLLVLIMVTASLMNLGTGRDGRKAEPQKPQPAAPVSAPVQAVISSAKTTQPAPSKPETAVDQSSSRPGEGSGLVLRLKVNQDGSLNITIDDALSQSYDLKAGDVIEWKGEKSIALDLGNAGGVEGDLNGKPLGPFGAPGQAAHIVLTDRK